jgi:alpha-L-rhamnosidase
LIKDIMVTRKGHFSTGQFGTEYLMQALTAEDCDKVAYTLMTQRDFPSFGLMLDHESTTTWETWGEDVLENTLPGKPPVSIKRPLSHPQFVGVDRWFYEGIAGIQRDDSRPGFGAVVLRPHLIEQLDWAKCRYHSVRGRIESDWSKENGKFIWSITVPPNTTATAYIPAKSDDVVTESGKPLAQAEGVVFQTLENGRAICELQSGSYVFETKLKSRRGG